MSKNKDIDHKKKELKTYRLLLLITVVAYPVFGIINTLFLHTESTQNLVERIFFAVGIILMLFLSYIKENVKENFYLVITVFTYIGFSHLTSIGLRNGFSFDHALGMILVLIGTSFVYRRIRHLFYYLIYNVLIVSLAALNAPKNELNSFTVIAIFGSIAAVTYFALQLRVKSQLMIKGSQANINALIENTSGIVWSIDQHLKYLAFNLEYKKLIENLTNQTPLIGDLVIDFSTSPTLETIYELVLNGEKYILEQEILIDNKTQYFQFSFSPILFEEQKVIGITIFGTDFTSKKLQEQEILKQQKQLTKAQEIAKLGSWSYHLPSKQFSISQELSNLFEINHQPNENFFELYKLFLTSDQDKISVQNKIDQLMLTKEGFQDEHLVNLKNGKQKWVKTIIDVVVHDSNIEYINGVAQDITTEKNYALNLQKSKELEENLRKTKEQFMANMSHEIRTPLNGILGFTKLLLQDKSLTENQIKQLNAIKSSGDILLVIINDILDISKIEAGKLNIEEAAIDLRLICEQTIETFSVKLSEKNIDLHFSFDEKIPSDLLGDSVRIAQILINLISNAIKFTPDFGKVKLVCFTEEIKQNESIICIQIEDSGIGIPADKLSTIFDPFTQSSEDTTRKFGGTGLGLNIVKRLVDLMHGKITLTSQTDLGTKFSISLPLKTGKKINIIENQEVENKINFDPKEVYILIAEDNLINQLLIKTVLDQFEFKYTCVENGKLAVEELEKNQHYNIILMDLMMPEMDGYEATHQIRINSNPKIRQIPVIALTADVTAIDMEKSKQIGMNGYISKPFEPKDLFNKISSLLKK